MLRSSSFGSLAGSWKAVGSGRSTLGSENRKEYGPLCSFFFQYVPSRSVQLQLNLDTKFYLHAAGGIYVYYNFANSGGKIEISGSSAKESGGAVLRSSSFGSLAGSWKAVGSGRSTLGSENRKEYGPLCSFFFPICPVPFSTASVEIWIPSSASTPQVGFMSMTTSPTRKETSKFQIRRRIGLEVPCSGL